jgi:hypothetical protein
MTMRQRRSFPVTGFASGAGGVVTVSCRLPSPPQRGRVRSAAYAVTLQTSAAYQVGAVGNGVLQFLDDSSFYLTATVATNSQSNLAMNGSGPYDRSYYNNEAYLELRLYQWSAFEPNLYTTPSNPPPHLWLA